MAAVATVTVPRLPALPRKKPRPQRSVDDLLERWHHLGTAKLYVLRTLDEKTLSRMGPYERHPIPGTDRAKTLEEMTLAELTLVARAFSGRLDGIVQLDRFLRSHRRRLHDLLAPRWELPDRSHHVDAELANELTDALLDAVTVLLRAFQLS
jgi:hypothetical protein